MAVPEGTNVRASFSVFASTRRVQENPREWAAWSVDGYPALPGPANPVDGLAWGWVCPRHPTYLEQHVLPVLQGIRVPVILQDFQYPSERFCFCARCQRAYAGQDPQKVRETTLRNTFRRLAKVTSGPIWLTLHPAPCTLDRFGIPEDVICQAEALMVPVYDLTYRLTYWMEDILSGFVRRFPGKVWVQLYGVEPPVEGLIRAVSVVTRYPVEGVVFYVNRMEKLCLLGRRLVRTDVSLLKALGVRLVQLCEEKKRAGGQKVHL